MSYAFWKLAQFFWRQGLVGLCSETRTAQFLSPLIFQNVYFLPYSFCRWILLCKIRILACTIWFSRVVGLCNSAHCVCVLCLHYFVLVFSGKVTGTQGDPLQQI